MGAETSKLQEATEEVQQEIEQQAAVQEVSCVLYVYVLCNHASGSTAVASTTGNCTLSVVSLLSPCTAGAADS